MMAMAGSRAQTPKRLRRCCSVAPAIVLSFAWSAPLLHDGRDLIEALLHRLLWRLGALQGLLDLRSDRLGHFVVIGRDEAVIGVLGLLKHDGSVGQRLLDLRVGQKRKTDGKPSRL